MKVKTLDGLRDRPKSLIAMAERMANSPEVMKRRQAAETVHLAMYAAVARAIKGELRGNKDFNAQVTKILGETSPARSLVFKLRKNLHEECFYRGEKKACARKAVKDNIKLAKTVIELIGGEP